MSTPINISASRGAAILGLSKWKTPVQVWLEIVESREPGFCAKNNYELLVKEENPSMRWGTAFESAIIELAKMKEGCIIHNQEKYFNKHIHKGNKREEQVITCHIDGQFSETGQPLHEGKTTTLFYFADNFGEDGTDQVPMEYQIQCQHQMICTGADKVILSVLVFPKRPEEWEDKNWIVKIHNNEWIMVDGNGITHNQISWAKTLSEMGFFHQFTITAHPKLQKSMMKHYSDFWFNNVLKQIPPDPINIDDIKLLCREPVGTIIADENIERQLSELENIKTEIGQGGSLSKRAAQIKLSILEYMRSAEKTIDTESDKKWILRGSDGKKLATYGKNKNGEMYFR